MKKPLIAVLPLVDFEKQSLWMLPGYFEGIMEAGGIPVMLPLFRCEADIEQAVSLFDGFLFTGGHDISPALYGESKDISCGQVCQARDFLEVRLLRCAIEADKACLGICRGLQLLNVAEGGTLYQDLATNHPSHVVHCQKPPYDTPSHIVHIAPLSPLERLLGQGDIAVNSYHHQAIRKLAPSLEVMARAPDGIIEAVRLRKARFVWAVQWHPEFSHKTDAASQKLFSAFIQHCALPA